MKKGWIVAVEFLDHAIEFRNSVKDETEMRFTVYGEIKNAKGKFLTVFTWKHHDPDCCEENSETAKILKSAIVKLHRLKRLR